MYSCPTCASIYPSDEEAKRCAGYEAEPERIAPNTLVEARGAPAETGVGLVSRSFLIGLDDPRGEPHTRFYRASFLWGRADFREGDLATHGPATETEWRALVESGRGIDRLS